jgi:hypothetical protein
MQGRYRGDTGEIQGRNRGDHLPLLGARLGHRRVPRRRRRQPLHVPYLVERRRRHRR